MENTVVGLVTVIREPIKQFSASTLLTSCHGVVRSPQGMRQGLRGGTGVKYNWLQSECVAFLSVVFGLGND